MCSALSAPEVSCSPAQAGPVKNRWLVAASAVGIHVSIGGVYAYSVYAKPIREAHGWSYGQVATAFSLAIAFLGLSAAFLGRFSARKGPRTSARLAAVFYAIGLAVAGWSMVAGSRFGFYLGYGVLGGIGLGLGYIAPVATLIKWFPDRRGLASGLAIMGFGFGALLGGPLIRWLLETAGLAPTFWILAASYFTVMMGAAQYLEAPPEGWTPTRKGSSKEMDAKDRAIAAGKTPARAAAPTTATGARALSAGEALRTRRFWFLWAMLFLNITCGIALLAVASPLGQEIAGLTTAGAATMVGLMGLFNGLGRIGWATLSDRIGRPATFVAFFAIQLVAFPLLPQLSHAVVFQAVLFLILTCYGGGFATAPAYVGDLFGAKDMAVIYGYLLTAWSAAGVIGPLVAAEVRDRTGSFAGMLYSFTGLFVIALGLAAALAREIKRERDGRSPVLLLKSQPSA